MALPLGRSDTLAGKGSIQQELEATSLFIQPPPSLSRSLPGPPTSVDPAQARVSVRRPVRHKRRWEVGAIVLVLVLR